MCALNILVNASCGNDNVSNGDDDNDGAAIRMMTVGGG